VISEEINEGNATFMLSQAFVLKADSLKSNLEDLIVTKLLTPLNCTQFLLDALKFNSEKI
jgi:hypothetical protein